MFTAKDMHTKREALNKCEGIDEWLEDTLFKKFIQGVGNTTVVYTSDFGSRGWTRLGFHSEMAKRGFHVEFKSDQRDGDYYQISYPPQER